MYIRERLNFSMIDLSCLPGMLIFVRTERGDNIIIDVNAGDPIEIIKDELRDRHVVPLGQQPLFYASRQLEDGRRVLDYNIEEESTVFVMLRLPGGMQTSVARSVHGWQGG